MFVRIIWNKQIRPTLSPLCVIFAFLVLNFTPHYHPIVLDSSSAVIGWFRLVWRHSCYDTTQTIAILLFSAPLLKRVSDSTEPKRSPCATWFTVLLLGVAAVQLLPRPGQNSTDPSTVCPRRILRSDDFGRNRSIGKTRHGWSSSRKTRLRDQNSTS